MHKQRRAQSVRNITLDACVVQTHVPVHSKISSRLCFKVSNHVRRSIPRLSHDPMTMDTDMQQHPPPPHALLRATRPISFSSIDLFCTVPPKLQQRFGSDLHSRRSFVSFLPFVIININIHPNQHCPCILIIHASQSHPTARSGANPFDSERRSTRL